MSLSIRQLFDRITKDHKVNTVEIIQVRNKVNADGRVDAEERAVLAQLDTMLRKDTFTLSGARTFDDGAAAIMRNDMRLAQGVKPIPGSVTLTDPTTRETFEFGKIIEAQLNAGLGQTNTKSLMDALQLEINAHYDATKELVPSAAELLVHYQAEMSKPYEGVASDAIKAAAATSGNEPHALYLAARNAIHDAALKDGKSEKVAAYLASYEANMTVSNFLGKHVSFSD